MVTAQHEQVLATQDKEATVYAARARSAVNMQKAAEALRGGRKDEAKGYLQQNQALFHEASAVSGAAAVASDMAEQQATMDEYDSADSEEESRAAVKKSKVRALKSFGKLGSTY